jgi:hypothetical protein
MDKECLKLWELLRAKIAAEDHWIQQRVSWLLVSNAFLFAAFASLLSIDASNSLTVRALRSFSLIVVPIGGVIVAVFVFIGLEGARAAIRIALEEASKLIEQKDLKKLPSLHSTGNALQYGRLATSGITISIGLAWYFILVVTLCVRIVEMFPNT